MADLELFSSLGGPAASTTAETKPLSFPAPSTLASSLPPLAAPSSGAGRKALSGADDFGDFALFGSSSLGVSVPSAGAAHIQDNFADFMVFGSASSSGVPEQKTAEEKPSENNSSVGETPLQQQQQKSSDKYDIFKRLSLEGSTTPLSFEDAKESLSAGLASSSSVVKGDADDFADFHSSRFSSALGASEKSLVDKVAAFKQAKEDSASVKSLDLPSIGGSSAGKEDSEDALSVQLDMKLSDLGGELQHVLSDSSLDLPVVSGHQPPAAALKSLLIYCIDLTSELIFANSTIYPPPPKNISMHPKLQLHLLVVINKANDTLNGISSSSVCTEVIQSAQGMEYLLGVVEVYRVVRRVELGIKATAVCSDKLQQLLKDINRVWHNLIGFMSLANLSPDESSLDFSSCILRHGIKNAKELACGVCLLSVDSRSKAFSSETDSFKLMYGGHQYHASCANFWINCVEPKPPGLILPDLL
ncbi:UNVERIFIED_CONTAM: hypothetical protein FKN15_027723 [Acipenser sinensis]